MVAVNNFTFLTDPIKLQRVLWPHVTFYRQQRQIIYSVWEDDETISVAGNMLGKDYVAGFICLAFFLTRTPCRVLTTSVDSTQLEGVLWGEIRRFIQESKYPLESEKGGPLVVNHLNIRKVFTSGIKKGELCPRSYLKGRTAAKGEGMLGHHIETTQDRIPRTLFVADEASGVDDQSYNNADTWANRKLIIGNPYPCTNFFYRGVEGGDVKREVGEGYSRRVITIRAQDSPNVRYAEAQIANGQPVTNDIIIPGVLPYDKYRDRRRRWDIVRQTIGLDARFYKGRETLLYPPQWLARAERYARLLNDLNKKRKAKAMGVDPAEGGDSSVWSIGDEWGLMKLVSLKTPDTSVICGRTLSLMREYDIPAEMVAFDRGGGKQHADYLREMGHNVRTVGFGDSPSAEPTPEGVMITDGTLGDRENRYAYKNRRAQMYGEFALLLDPVREQLPKVEGEEIAELLEEARKLRGQEEKPVGFGIPPDDEFEELRRQMSLIPKLHGKEGELRLPPKRKLNTKSQEQDLISILGCSPDELDATVLMVHTLLHQPDEVQIGALG